MSISDVTSQQQPVESSQVLTIKSNDMLHNWSGITEYGNGAPISSALDAGFVYVEKEDALASSLLRALMQTLQIQGVQVQAVKKTSTQASDDVLKNWQVGTDSEISLAIGEVLKRGMLYGRENPGMITAMLAGIAVENKV